MGNVLGTKKRKKWGINHKKCFTIRNRCVIVTSGTRKPRICPGLAVSGTCGGAACGEKNEEKVEQAK